MTTFSETDHPRESTGRFAIATRSEAPVSLALHSTGVQIHQRSTGADYGVHDECLAALQEMSPEAFGPLDGDFAVIGPVFGEFDCALNTCSR